MIDVSELVAFGRVFELSLECARLQTVFCFPSPAAMAAAEKVKNPWTELHDKDGTPFYYNSVTKESVWEKPKDFYDADIKAGMRTLVTEWQRLVKAAEDQQKLNAVEKQSAKATKKQSAKAVKKQPAKAAEKQSAKAAEQQPAKAVEQQSAKANEKHTAKVEDKQPAISEEKEPAKEKEPATSMEVEDSEESESDFRPVVKARRKKSTETSVIDGQKARQLLSNSNNNANTAAEKTTPVLPASGQSSGGKKQPPLVVKNTSFARLEQMLSSCDVKPQLKLIRHDIKVTCFSIEDFDTVQALLKKNEVQFYTYGRRCERPHRVVIRGLPSLDPEFIQKLLKDDHQLNALAVQEIKRKKQLPAVNETPFIVLFPKGHTSLEELRNKVKKVGLMVIRWEAFRSKGPQVTQCKNCLQFGHGTSNCHLKPKCSSCGGPHSTEKCEAEETQAKKCVNCSGSHEGLDRSCPKRAQFIQSRQQASKPKPTAWKKDKRSPKVPVFSPADFPPLPDPVQDKPKKKAQSEADAGSKQGNTGPSVSPENAGPCVGGNTKEEGEEELYSSEELWRMLLGKIWRIFTKQLRSCKTRSDQERVVGYIARKLGAD